MLNTVQHAVQVFANLVVASTMGLCLAIGVAGTMQHRFPLDCGACLASSAPVLISAKPVPLVLARAN
jgi:hypothetical protein